MEKQYFGEYKDDIYIKEGGDLFKLVEFSKDGIDQMEGEKVEDDTQNLLQVINFSDKIPDKCKGYVEAGLERPLFIKPPLPIKFGQKTKEDSVKKKKKAPPPVKKQKVVPAQQEIDLTEEEVKEEPRPIIRPIVTSLSVDDKEMKEEPRPTIQQIVTSLPLELKRSETYEDEKEFNSFLDFENAGF